MAHRGRPDWCLGRHASDDGLGGLLRGSGSSRSAGNNGTVKIDGVEFDTHPDNEPHVGCIFQVDFYGFDVTSPTGFVTFETQAADHQPAPHAGQRRSRGPGR